MRKIFQFSWLPMVAIAIIVIIYGGAALAQDQKQNQALVSKLDQLTRKIDQLEGKIGQQNVQIAGVSDEGQNKETITDSYPSETSESQLISSIPEPSPTSEPSPTPFSTATPKPKLSSVSTSTPVPTPTSTPRPSVRVEIENVGDYSVSLEENDTAFLVLLRAGQENNFTIDYQIYEGLGAFVNCIADICAHDNYYWAFYYNGQYSLVGASSQPVFENDMTTWKFETW